MVISLTATCNNTEEQGKAVAGQVAENATTVA